MKTEIPPTKIYFIFSILCKDDDWRLSFPALNTCSKSFFFLIFFCEGVGGVRSKGFGGWHAELCSLAAVGTAQNELSLREELVEYTGQETPQV